MLQSSPSREDGVVHLLVGVRQAADLFQGTAVALCQQVVAGRVQYGSQALEPQTSRQPSPSRAHPHTPTRALAIRLNAA